jgi:hypothetical protein
MTRMDCSNGTIESSARLRGLSVYGDLSGGVKYSTNNWGIENRSFANEPWRSAIDVEKLREE